MNAPRALALSTAVIAATVALAPILPSVDFPQHVAAAELLRRLVVEPASAPDVMLNPATHNAGVQVFSAALGQLVGVHLAARLFFALALVLQVLGLRSLCEGLGLPKDRALVLVPVLLGFSMVWGLANFAMGTGLSLVALGLLVKQLDKPSRAALGLPVLSLLVSLTHVMTMLLLAIFAASLGLERLVRKSGEPAEGGGGARAWLRTGALGSLLLPGCFYDLWVLSRHLGIDAGSYTTADDFVATPGPLRKLALVGTLGSGLYAPFTDIVLTWALVVALVVALVRGLRLRERSPALSVLGVSLLLYVAIPSVFLNTHLVYQRLAMWVIIGLGLSVPVVVPPFRGVGASSVSLELVLTRLALGAAMLAPLHFGVLAWETRHLRAVLADVPRGVRLTGVIEAPRARSLRTPTLSHVHALAVAAGAEDATFSFARYMGGPVVYRPGRVPPYPSPSWEHDGHGYRWNAPLARSFPWVLVHVADGQETTDAICARVFAERCDDARLVSRHGDTALWDTTAMNK